MMRCARFFAASVLFVLGTAAFAASAAFAQQLPAGTQEADVHPREDAVNARIESAEAALAKQDYAGAELALKQLAIERPKDGRVLYDLGFAEERTGEEDAAAAAYVQAIAANATLEEPRVALGLLDARAGRIEKARSELLDAAHLESASPELRARAFRALASMDEVSRPDDARDELLAAVKLTAETQPDIVMSAELATRAGDTADAEAAYRRALAEAPDDIEAVAGLAHVLEQEKKYNEAETLLTGAIKTHPDDPRLVSQLAAAYADEGKPAQAIPLVESLRASQPALAADSNVTRLLAQLYAANGQNADAEKLYTGLVASSPNDPLLLDDLGDALVKQEKFAEAESVLARAVALRSAFASQQDWGVAAGQLAFAASKNHDPQTALQALADRATVLPNSASSLFLQAISQDALHQRSDAIKSYRAFLAMAGGKSSDEEFQARHRLIALEHER